MYTLRGTLVGIYLPVYVPGVYWWVYTSLYMYLPIHPGYTHHPTLLMTDAADPGNRQTCS